MFIKGSNFITAFSNYKDPKKGMVEDHEYWCPAVIRMVIQWFK